MRVHRHAKRHQCRFRQGFESGHFEGEKRQNSGVWMAFRGNLAHFAQIPETSRRRLLENVYSLNQL
jgi:hypothetical protein